MTANKDLQKSQGDKTNPYETALLLIGVMGLLGGLLTANLSFESTQTSPWPGFLAQALIMLGGFSLVGWLLASALRR